MAPASRGWREGIIVGLIAYASVAVFYSFFDLLAAFYLLRRRPGLWGRLVRVT